MADVKSKLDEDLAMKLDHLVIIREQPALFLDEHFASIRNEIDLDAERLLQDIQDRCTNAVSETRIYAESTDSDSEEEYEYEATNASFINQKRSEFMSILEAFDKEDLSSKGTNNIDPIIEVFKQRVAAFIASKNYQDLNQIEEAYVSLALDIIDATNEQEKKLLDKRCFVYVPSRKKKHLGDLVHLSEGYLNEDKLSCLRKLNYTPKSFNLKDIHKEAQRSLNRRLAVGVCRPFFVDKNIITIICHQCQLFSYACETETVRIFGKKLSKKIIDGVDILEMPECLSATDYFNFSFSNNRLTFFKMGEWLFNKLSSLNLSYNFMETLDGDLLAKFANLTKLELTSSCLPNAKFSLDFLSHLSGLIELNLTLPDAPVDFAVFSNLSKLEKLELYGASSMDFNLEPLKLTRDACRQLSTSASLKRLGLTHFEIETIDSKTFGESESLEMLELRSTRIGEIIDGAFEKVASSFMSSIKSTLRLESIGIRNLTSGMLQGLRDLQILNLSNNEIEELPEGAFDNLKHLEYLDLSHNRIRFIKHVSFDGLISLTALNLNRNPIESIEANAFVLRNLTLMSCKLKCINNQMFNGSDNLDRLMLYNNQIESFEIITESGILSIDGFLTEKEFRLVNKCLFCNLRHLTVLSLGRNKLKKMDLNLFCFLFELLHLDLSNNMITELNTETFDLNLGNLELLKLEGNQLKSIEKGAFSHSYRLQELDLSHNKLERLDGDFFKPFEQLKFLYLQNNNLSIDITDDTFSRCYDIEEINLLDNKEVRVEVGAFKRLRRLHTLRTDLTDALILIASPDDDESSDESLNYSDDEEESNDSLSSSSSDSVASFGTKKNHRTLVIANSQAELLKKFLSFEKNASLSRNIRKLGLVNSEIETLDGFKLSDRIIRLDLSKNRLKTVDSGWIKDFKELKDLNVAGNLIETLQDENLFRNNLELLKLNLSGNKLNQINRKLFKDLYKLESLDLSNNPALATIDCGIFRGLFSLKQLNMSGNNITSFDLSSLFHSCRSLESLDLSNNQLDHESVNEASMNGSTAQSLKELMLANNRLERMDFVRHLYRLEKLDLSGNKIESISWNGINVLGKLNKLNRFNLSSNQIKSLEESVISFLNQQKIYFDVSNNPMGDVNLLNILK